MTTKAKKPGPAGRVIVHDGARVVVSGKCHECGSRDVAVTIAPRPITLGYGPKVPWEAIVDDTIVTSCEACGSEAHSYRKLGPMMRAIAAAVVRKPSRLVGVEIKFLRNHLGLEGKELARVLGVGASTVSRWENDREPIGAVPDRLLRTVEVIRDDLEFDVEVLGSIAGDKAAPLSLRLRLRDGEWKAAA